MNRKLRLPLALALALGSSHALALGLGQIEVKSALYQPLDAQIPVLSTTPGEAANLKVRLASPEDFARVGLDSSSMLSANLEFSVHKDASGKPVIHVTTDSKLNDPFVTFLLEVDWGKGRLLREFTVLLDPPLTAPVSGSAAPARVPRAVEPLASEPVAVETMPAPEPEPVESTPTPAPAASTPPPSIPAQTSPAPEPVAPAPAPPPQPAPAMPAPTPAPMPGNEYGPTISGDTLWSIAGRVRPAGVDMNQTMLALLNANPEAFIGNNINRLKKGAVLRIPSASEMVATGLGDARVEVARQMDAWRASVGQAQPQPEVADRRSSAPPPRGADSDRSRLELVPPKGDASGNGAQSGVAANSAGTELRRDLQRAREDISARDQEISELKSRVDELEKIEGDSKRLIDMQNSELARLRDRLAELEAADAADTMAAAGSADATGDDSSDSDSMDADAMSATSDATGSSSDTAGDDADAAADDATDAAGAADADDMASEVPPPALTPPVTRPQPSTTPAEAPATATTPPPPAPAMPWYRNLWVMVGAAAVLLGLLLFGLMRIMRGGKAKAEPNRRVSDSLAASAAPVAAAGDDDDGMSDREIELLEALSEQPEDLDRHLELVRYYYEQGNEDAFEGAAEAMYAQCADDPGNLAWRQVVAMGREVIPDHPMFQEDEPLPATDESDAFAAALAADVPPADEPAEAPAAAAEPDAGADFSWEEPAKDAAPEPVAEPPAAAPQREEVDFGDFSEPEAAPPVDVPPAPTPAPVDVAPAAAPSGDMDEDAAATKLELARAYLDMGDIEGARGMLEEVLGEGNPGQRDEARRLLDEIR